MSTATITREDAIEEFLLTQGASKATVIAKGVHLSETATRKVLNDLVEQGHVTKTGQLFGWVKKANKKAPAEKASNGKREAVASRDAMVLAIITKFASADEKTISREAILDKLIAKGHVMSGSFVYLSLYRLHTAGEIERVHVGKRYPEWRIAS